MHNIVIILLYRLFFYGLMFDVIIFNMGYNYVFYKDKERKRERERDREKRSLDFFIHSFIT